MMASACGAEGSEDRTKRSASKDRGVSSGAKVGGMEGYSKAVKVGRNDIALRSQPRGNSNLDY